MHGLEILDRSGAPQIEHVLAHTEVARTASLARSDVGERVFDRDAVAELRAPRRSSLQLSKLLLLRLILGDRYAAALAGCGLRAVRATRTGTADLGIEVNGLAGLEGLHLPSGARDGLRAEVDVEVRLGEQAGLGRAQSPWFREYRAPGAHHRCDHGAGHVGAVDVELVEREALVGDVFREGGGTFFLGSVRGRHPARHDRPRVEVEGNVLLESVEPLRAALAAMAHLGVFDRDAPVDGDSLSDLYTACGQLQVLVADRRDGFQVLLQRRVDAIVQMLLDPPHQRRHLALHDLNRTHLLARVAPVDVEPGFEAR